MSWYTGSNHTPTIIASRSLEVDACAASCGETNARGVRGFRTGAVVSEDQAMLLDEACMAFCL